MEALPTRHVVARNTAAGEADSIHDDAYATRAGYRGGLVPGVTLLAYLTATLIDAYGAAWPERGRLRARFVRPVYHGEELEVRAAFARRGGAGSVLECRIERSDGAIAVEAEAACASEPAPAPGPQPWRRGVPTPRPRRATDPDGALPPLLPETLVVGEELAPLTYHVSHADAVAWAAQADDASEWYRGGSPFDGPIVHPAMLARDPISLLRHNFARKATIHAESDLSYLHAGRPDRDYTVYGNVADVYERRGNGYVVVDTLTVDEDGREIVRNRHTSLIRLGSEAATR
jgi:acyl dehydratase